MTLLIISAFLFVLVFGFVLVRKRYVRIVNKHSFAMEYRNKLVDLANRYFQTYEKYYSQGTLDNTLYIWLTKNVNQIQSDLGHLGTMHYMAPFQIYQISNYQIVINTLPKFRDGSIEPFDVNASDDCFIRYVGVLERSRESIEKQLRNPIIWFREGFQEMISLPLIYA
jgi:hypothetical protein